LNHNFVLSTRGSGPGIFDGSYFIQKWLGWDLLFDKFEVFHGNHSIKLEITYVPLSRNMPIERNRLS
jgi:hypothetical protein